MTKAKKCAGGWRGQEGSRHERGYGSAWTKLRLSILTRDKHLCQVCMAEGRITPARMVDHIKAKAEGGTDDQSNLRAICDEHHAAKTTAEGHRAAGHPDEYAEFNTKALLRSSFKDHIEALAKSTVSGIHSPDEARNEEDLPVVPDGAGKEPRVQQQVVPLSFGAKPPEVPASAPPPPVEEPDLPDDAAKAVAEVEFRRMLAA